MTTGKPVAYANATWDEETLVGTRNGAFHVRVLRYPNRDLAEHVDPPRRRVAERVLRAMDAVAYELRDGLLHHEHPGFAPLPAAIGTREAIALGTTDNGRNGGELQVHWRCRKCKTSRRTRARNWQTSYAQAIQRGNISEAECAKCHRLRHALKPISKVEAKDERSAVTYISARVDFRARGKQR